MAMDRPDFRTGSLEGARAVITGATGGIGRAVAHELASRGATVALLARTREKLEAVRAEIGGDTVVISCDLTLGDTPANVLNEVRSRWGRLDILVHSSGEYLQKAVSDSTIDDLDAVYRNNIRPPYALTLELLRLLKEAEGQVVFVNSSITRAANIAQRGLFAASQHALRALADGLRDEVNPEGVRVINVYPGTTATARAERMFAAGGRAYDPQYLLQAEDVAAAIGNALSLPRTAEVTDLYIRPMRKAP